MCFGVGFCMGSLGGSPGSLSRSSVQGSRMVLRGSLGILWLRSGFAKGSLHRHFCFFRRAACSPIFNFRVLVVCVVLLARV